MAKTITLRVDDNEMKEIMFFEKDIDNGLDDIEKGRYKIIG